jgi:hypothetical protein
MSETAKSSSEGKSTRIEAGDVQAKLRGIARELDYGMPVLTREWRKRTAGELEALASEWVK